MYSDTRMKFITQGIIVDGNSAPLRRMNLIKSSTLTELSGEVNSRQNESLKTRQHPRKS